MDGVPGKQLSHYTLDFLTNVDWANRLSENVSKELLAYAVLYPRREQISPHGLVMQA